MLSLCRLKRFKVTQLFALSAMLICVMGVFAQAYDTQQVTPGELADTGVYWEIGVGNLDINDDGWTYSDHHYSVDNYSSDEIECDWEFTHRIMQLGPGKSLKKKMENAAELRSDKLTGFFTIDVGALGEYRSGVQMAYHDNLPTGTYYIDAYTKMNVLNVADNTIRKTSRLFEK